MIFTKLPVSVPDQISLLKSKGLIINDEKAAEIFFYNNNYYRFRGYTYPFQDNSKSPRFFINDINFETILDLYKFDSELRLLILDAIEKIEISLRTQIIHQYAIGHKNSHWHFNSKLFINPNKHETAIEKLCSETRKSHEDFIKHYYQTYTYPIEPPCWASLETVTFGYLSNLFSNLKPNSCKKEISKHFGLPAVHILENWMHCLNNIRNICAHHSRLWNRSFAPRIKLPQNTDNLFIDNKKVYTNKIYAMLCCIQYLLNIIDQDNGFKFQLIELIKKYPAVKIKPMGFPADWKEELFWKT